MVEIDHWRVACFTVHLPSPVRCTSDLKCSSFTPRLVFNSRWKWASSSLSCNKDSGTHKSDSGGGLGSAPTAHASELRSCNKQNSRGKTQVKHKTIICSKRLVTNILPTLYHLLEQKLEVQSYRRGQEQREKAMKLFYDWSMIEAACVSERLTSINTPFHWSNKLKFQFGNLLFSNLH